MSYPMELDDYTDKQLVIELASRCAQRSLNKCSYCRRPNDEPGWCGSRQHGLTAESLRKLLHNYGVI